MHRYSFYILTTLLTFGIGSFIALNLFWNSNPQTSANSEFLSNLSSKPVLETTFPKPVNPSLKQEEKPVRPFCNDKNIRPIWKHLINDRDFREWSPISDERNDCKDMLEIKRVDLNQDGNKEILILGKSLSLCSPVGNCAFWIFEKRGKSYQKLIYSNDYIDITKNGQQLQRKKTNGYFDILLKGHLSASDTSYEFYKYNGKNYKLHKSLVQACIICVGENPKWEFMTWKEYKKLNS